VLSQSGEDISDCNGLSNFGQNRQQSHISGHSFSCMRHINAEFGFDIAFQLSANSPTTLPYTSDKLALPSQPILRQELFKMSRGNARATILLRVHLVKFI